MANIIAKQDGNFTDAATWGQVDTTSLLESIGGETTVTTSYVESSSFSPGAITIEGIAVLSAQIIAASPSGTLSVRLAQGGSLVAGTEVSINMTDLGTLDFLQGWVFFKFAAPVTLLAATAYTVSVKTSASGQLSLWTSSAGNGNWSRMLRTNGTAAPGAADRTLILGQWTAPATKTNITVTMNNTATTSFGRMDIVKGGKLAFANSASTNYVLRLAGDLAMFQGAQFEMGTSLSPIPATSTANLQFDCSSDGQYGVLAWGVAGDTTFTACGSPRTAGKNVVRCKLNTDEAAAQTTLGVDTDTGWKSGDEIAIASTTRTASQAETRTLNADAGASSVVVTSGLTNAHSGTSPTQAEVVLITRNVVVRSVSTSNMSYCQFDACTVNCQWTLFRYLGVNTSTKRGVEVIGVGSTTLSYCSLSDFEFWGLYFQSSTLENIVVDHLTGWKIGHQSSSIDAVYLGSQTNMATTVTFDDVCIISGNTGSSGSTFRIVSPSVGLNNIAVNSGGGNGITINIGNSLSNTKQTRAISNIDIHSMSGEGFVFSQLSSCYVQTLTSWRNTLGGVYIGSAFQELRIDNYTAFGNQFNAIYMETTAIRGRLKVVGGTLSGDSTFSSACGLNWNGNDGIEIKLIGVSFGVASGIKTAFTSSDLELNVPSSTPRWIDLTLNNCVLGSTTEIGSVASQTYPSVIRRQRADGVTNIHSTTFVGLGVVARETTTFRTTAPSQKLTPTTPTTLYPLESAPFRVPGLSGQDVSVSVYVRKDGSYNGMQPVLMARANPSIGLNSDTVIATMTGGASAWEQLAGQVTNLSEDGVVEFYVAITGTAGNVYVDDQTGSAA